MVIHSKDQNSTLKGYLQQGQPKRSRPRQPKPKRATRAKSQSTEFQIQRALVTKCRREQWRYPDLEWLYSIPNQGIRAATVELKGGRRISPEGIHRKAEGVQAGVLDLHLPVARGGYVGLWLETKTPGKSWSASQKRWRDGMRGLGHRVELYTSAEQGWNILMAYLKSELGHPWEGRQKT